MVWVTIHRKLDIKYDIDFIQIVQFPISSMSSENFLSTNTKKLYFLWFSLDK